MRSAGGGGTSVSLFGSARPAPVASCIGHHGSIPGAEAIEMPSNYACPYDLVRYLGERGAHLVGSWAALRFGRLGKMIPLEVQGSAVFAWRVGS